MSQQRLTMSKLARQLGISRATLYRQIGDASETGLATRKTDAEIFAAVRDTMGTRGIRGTTLEAVAATAGVSVMTLRRRFKDRLGLLRAFMDALPARQAGRTLGSADPGAVEATLLDFTRLALTEMRESLPLTRALLGDPEAAKELKTSARDPARGVSAGVATYFARCVEAGTLKGDVGALTAVFLSALFGYGLVVGSFDERPLDAEVGAQLLVGQFLRGALP